jgi:hypothetical protein
VSAGGRATHPGTRRAPAETKTGRPRRRDRPVLLLRGRYFGGETFAQLESGLYAVIAFAAAAVPGPRFFW